MENDGFGARIFTYESDALRTYCWALAETNVVDTVVSEKFTMDSTTNAIFKVLYTARLVVLSVMRFCGVLVWFGKVLSLSEK